MNLLMTLEPNKVRHHYRRLVSQYVKRTDTHFACQSFCAITHACP